MKPKKSTRANLENQRSIFLQIGLIITLGLILVAFEWSSSIDHMRSFEITEGYNLEEDIMQVTREKEIKPPPPPVPPSNDVLNVTEDDKPIKNEFIGIEVEPVPWQEIEIDPYEEAPETTEELPFLIVEKMPKFKGEGIEGFHNWIMKNLKYPEIAAENGISGKVYIQFVVNTKGEVEDAVIMRGVDPALNDEALRAVNSSPKWTPGEQRGKPVKVQFTIPIKFILQ